MSCSRQERIPQSVYENGTELRRGPWTLEEDSLLGQYIACHGEGRWNSLAKLAGLKRTGKSCRLRWLNYLKPNIKCGNLSHEEQLLILELHSKWGNRSIYTAQMTVKLFSSNNEPCFSDSRWSRIAQHLPGRTDNEIKNYWRTRVQKQARLLNIESNSNKFLEAIRMYWMPNLVEKMEQNSSSITSQSSSISIQENQNQNLCQGNLLSSSLKPGNQVNNPDRDSISTNILEYPKFLTAPGGQSLPGKSVEDDCYRVGIPGCDIQDFNPSGCHVEIDWPGEDLGSTFWDADEPW